MKLSNDWFQPRRLIIPPAAAGCNAGCKRWLDGVPANLDSAGEPGPSC